jgi:RecB family endonuclease NucS
LALVVREHLTQLHAVPMVLILLLLLDVRPTHQLVVEVEEILMHQVVDLEEQAALEVVLENQKMLQTLPLKALIPEEQV